MSVSLPVPANVLVNGNVRAPDWNDVLASLRMLEPTENEHVIPVAIAGGRGMSWKIKPSALTQLGLSVPYHPWQIVVAAKPGGVATSGKGVVVIPSLLDSPSVTDVITVVGANETWDVPSSGSVVRVYLEVELDTEGAVSVARRKTGASWWEGYPQPYRMTTTETPTQDRAWAAIGFVKFGRVGQSVRTGLMMEDRCVDGHAVRLPVPGQVGLSEEA